MKKILFLNGSPRLKGNTRFALKTIESEINTEKNSIEFLDVTKFEVSGCIACDACKINGGKCFRTDDTNLLVEKICEADTIIFGTPVYWWGVTAQLKALIDKFYSKMHGTELTGKKKKVILVSVGEDEVQAEQYKLIASQFKLICDYLGWEFILNKPISAYDINDLKNQENSIIELKNIAKLVN